MNLLKVMFVLLCFGSVLFAGEKDRPRVFVRESTSWQISGDFGGVGDVFGGKSSGGARPQTAEIIKTLGQRCSDCVVTMRQERADYTLLLEHEGGKDLSRKNKFVVFNKEGDTIASGSTRILGNAVKDACAAIMKDWAVRIARGNTAPAKAGESMDSKSNLRPARVDSVQ